MIHVHLCTTNVSMLTGRAHQNLLHGDQNARKVSPSQAPSQHQLAQTKWLGDKNLFKIKKRKIEMFLTFGCYPSVVRGRGQLRDGLTRPCGRLWCPLAVIWEINVSSGSLQCLPPGRKPATLTCSEVSTWIWLCSELFGLEARCPPQSLGCPVTSASVFIPKMELRCLGTEKQTDRTRTQGFPGIKTEHQSVLKRSVRGSYVPDLMQPQAAVFWGFFTHLKFSFHFILCPSSKERAWIWSGVWHSSLDVPALSEPLCNTWVWPKDRMLIYSVSKKDICPLISTPVLQAACKSQLISSHFRWHSKEQEDNLWGERNKRQRTFNQNVNIYPLLHLVSGRLHSH